MSDKYLSLEEQAHRKWAQSVNGPRPTVGRFDVVAAGVNCGKSVFMTAEEREKHYEDLCELAHDNETVLFAVKEIEKLTRQVIDLTAKLEGQTALAARRLKELENTKAQAMNIIQDARWATDVEARRVQILENALRMIMLEDSNTRLAMDRICAIKHMAQTAVYEVEQSRVVDSELANDN